MKKTKDDCIKGLKICATDDDHKDCDSCPYSEYAYDEKSYCGTNCDQELMKDILYYFVEESELP